MERIEPSLQGKLGRPIEAGLRPWKWGELVCIGLKDDIEVDLAVRLGVLGGKGAIAQSKYLVL